MKHEIVMKIDSRKFMDLLIKMNKEQIELQKKHIKQLLELLD